MIKDGRWRELQQNERHCNKILTILRGSDKQYNSTNAISPHMLAVIFCDTFLEKSFWETS